MNKKILFSLLCFELSGFGLCRAGMLPDRAFSDDARGTTSASFLKSPASARLAALGSGGAALKAPDAFFCNPAGVAYFPRGTSTFLLGYESLLEDAGRTALAGIRGLERGALGVGAVYRYETGLKKYNELGVESGGLEAYDAAITGFYGRRFAYSDVGLAVKYIRSRLSDRSAGAVALDMGVITKDKGSSNAELAFFARNLGSPLKLGSEKEPLPMELGVGLRWRHAPAVSIFIDGRAPVDHSPYLILAGEYAIPFSGSSALFLRCGFNFKNHEDLGLMGTFSSGFGLNLGKTSLDYAFVPYGDLGVTHRITLGWGFGTGDSYKQTDEVVRPVFRSGKLILTVATFEPGDKVSETTARQMSDMLEAELVKSGRFKLVERTRMDFIMNEKKLSYAGLTQRDASEELSRLLGAEAVVFGNVLKNNEGYLITMTMVDVVTGEILSADTRQVAGEHLFKQTARDMSAKLSAR